MVFGFLQEQNFATVERRLLLTRNLLTEVFVVKPKTTNYGVGISIFIRMALRWRTIKAAVRLAFAEDQSI